MLSARRKSYDAPFRWDVVQHFGSGKARFWHCYSSDNAEEFAKRLLEDEPDLKVEIVEIKV